MNINWKNAAFALSLGVMSLSVSGCSEAAEAQETKLVDVIATLANCRAAPDGDAAVQAQIGYGTTVAIQRQSGDWSEVERDGKACWVHNRLLGVAGEAGANASGDVGSGAWSSSSESTPNQSRAPILGTSQAQIWTGTGTTTKRTRSSTRKSTRSKRSSGGSRGYRLRGGGEYQSGSCPCSGSNVCIGPRGGRYCITSGGNKRYGV